MNRGKNNFSVLMSVYCKESASNLNESLVSLWNTQDLKPTEIVIVKDGQLTPDLEEVIAQWKAKLSDSLTTISLPNNVGLGRALNIGLSHCRYELVARMDSDDICFKTRFLKQIQYMNEHDLDICGSTVIEFSNNQNLQLKNVPESHNQILRYARSRNPINHPSVMVKKTTIAKVGGYQHFVGFEDYHLWIKCLQVGARFGNIQEPLVKMRVDNGQINRRRGRVYLKQEIKFHYFMYKMDFIPIYRLVFNIINRVPIRIASPSIGSRLYRWIRRIS